MRSPAIPHFEIGASMPVDLRAKTRTEAQRDLDAHQATCPGDYRPKEACNSAHNEAWRKWAAKKNDLTCAVEVAYSAETHPEVKVTKPRPGDRDPRLKDVGYYAEQMRLKVMEMTGMIPNSDEWQRARAAVWNYRGKCLKRAEVDGVEAPELPAVPSIPIEQRAAKGRKVLHDDARHAAERERKARMKARKLEVAS